LAVLFGGSLYLIRINIAREAGYERTVRVTQDDARVTDQIQGVAGGNRGSIAPRYKRLTSCTMGTSSAPYIRIPPSIGPVQCRISDMKTFVTPHDTPALTLVATVVK
jgi:hypothetical protein